MNSPIYQFQYKKLIKIFLPIVAGIGVWLAPAPGGLTPDSWAYLAIFIGVVVALVAEPFPAALIGIIGVTLATILRLVPLDVGANVTAKSAIEWGLSGFNDSTVWLIFTAYIFALGYQKTGLGKRISLHLLKIMGKRSFGLGYALAFADLMLAPFIPSNTARSGGTIFPIASNIPPMYGSSPDNEPRKMGSFLYWTALSTTCITSSMFLTGLAPNLLALSIVNSMTGIEISWLDWCIGFLPVGLFLFIAVPAINYLIYPPTIKQSIEMPEWAASELITLGPMTKHEIIMAILAVVALLFWVFANQWINATTTALLVLTLMVLSGIVTWSDVTNHNKAWDVLIWFATLVTLAGGLSKTGFLAWLASRVGQQFGGFDPGTMIILLVSCFFILHYFFASVTAHVTALLPVFLSLAMTIPDMPIGQISMLLCFTLGIMGIITPYATGPGPIWYGAGYIPGKHFWLLGFILGTLFLGSLLIIGIPWLQWLKY